MAKGRMIDKQICESDKWAGFKQDSPRLLYVLLIIWADREGRIKADSQLMKGWMFPKIRSWTENKILKCIQDLIDNEMIILYKIKKDDTIIQIKRFTDFQNIHPKEAKSIWPGPQDKDSAVLKLIQFNSNELKKIPSYIKLNRIDIKKKDIKEDWKTWFEEFWEAYDLKLKRTDSEKTFYSLLKNGVTINELRKSLNGYHAFLDYQKNEKNFDQSKMHPLTFLRSERWKNYLNWKKQDPL